MSAIELLTSRLHKALTFYSGKDRSADFTRIVKAIDRTEPTKQVVSMETGVYVRFYRDPKEYARLKESNYLNPDKATIVFCTKGDPMTPDIADFICAELLRLNPLVQAIEESGKEFTERRGRDSQYTLKVNEEKSFDIIVPEIDIVWKDNNDCAVVVSHTLVKSLFGDRSTRRFSLTDVENWFFKDGVNASVSNYKNSFNRAFEALGIPPTIQITQITPELKPEGGKVVKEFRYYVAHLTTSDPEINARTVAFLSKERALPYLWSLAGIEGMAPIGIGPFPGDALKHLETNIEAWLEDIEKAMAEGDQAEVFRNRDKWLKMLVSSFQ